MTNKNSREFNFDEFYSSLKKINNVVLVEKLGLQDTSMNVIISSSLKNEIGLKEIFIFSNDGNQLINCKFTKLIGFNTDKFYAKISKLMISINQTAKLKNGFNFHKIYFYTYKLVILIKSNIIICGIFNETTNSLLAKMYLLYIYSSLTNYCNTTILNLSKINMGGLIEIFSDKEIKNQSSRSNLKYNLNSIEFFPLRIFQDYFLKPLTSHFNKSLRQITNDDEINLSNIKFKNMYIIDISSQNIIYDMMSLRKSKKNKKYYKNDRLWSEIIYHSFNLMNSYKNNSGVIYNESEIANRYVKFECTSTFPRITCIIKFLPIFNGMTNIHIYSQKKLSRGNENETEIIKTYKEIDILYGTEIKDHPDIEFKYVEPKKLIEIESFFIELYMCFYTNSDLFYHKNPKINFFNDPLMWKINEFVNSNVKNFQIETLYNKLNNYLHEFHMKTKNITQQQQKFSKEVKGSSTSSNVFCFNIDEIVKEFFKDIDKKLNTSRLDATINLSKIDDIYYDQNDNSIDFLQKIAFTDNKHEEDANPSFINGIRNSYSSFSGIIINDIESKGNLKYQAIDNSINNMQIDNSINKLEVEIKNLSPAKENINNTNKINKKTNK